MGTTRVLPEEQGGVFRGSAQLRRDSSSDTPRVISSTTQHRAQAELSDDEVERWLFHRIHTTYDDDYQLHVLHQFEVTDCAHVDNQPLTEDQ